MFDVNQSQTQIEVQKYTNTDIKRSCYGGESSRCLCWPSLSISDVYQSSPIFDPAEKQKPTFPRIKGGGTLRQFSLSCHYVFQKFSQTWHRIVLKLSQSGPKVVSKSFPRSPRYPKVIPMLCQICLIVVPKSSQSFRKNVWNQFGAIFRGPGLI